MLETKKIGNKIAEARRKLNISQAQLAQRLFISPQAVGKWERGESMPDITTFNRLAEILGVDLNYFSESFKLISNEITSNVTTDGIDDQDKEVQDEANPTRSPKRQVPINLTAINLQNSDFAGVVLHKGKFNVSPLSGANFAGADLTCSSFDVSDACDANFDDANLTDCNFSITNLSRASFKKTILVRTKFSKLGMDGTKFADVKLTDVKLNIIDLRKTIFENCVFDGVDFKSSDLRGLCLDDQTFIDVRFDKSALNNVSFRGATLRNVTFILPFSLTNKAYRAMQTISFEGTKIDKLTYAALKGLWVFDLSKVTII